jgi:hypothetical protein
MTTTDTPTDCRPCTRAVVPVGEPRAMARELRRRLGNGPHALVVVFVAPGVDRHAFAAALQAEFGDTPVVGCTTAGEIGPEGLTERTAVACALGAGAFRVVHTTLEDVPALGMVEAQRRVAMLLGELRATAREPATGGTFALLLIDGLSIAEERVAGQLSAALGDVPLVGGSAGDGLDFASTHVFAHGRARARAAVLVLVQTELPFVVFKTQHFVTGEQRMVVTAADHARRTVFELDGERAAPEFARRLGLPACALDPTTFATFPVVVRVGGEDYVRSIQRVGDDGSMTFFCAIEEGIVLRDAHGIGMVENLERQLGDLRARIGAPELVIAFDCILRRLESRRTGVDGRIGELLAGANTVGFGTYGEQFRGMHVNQTLVGVAIGGARREGR